MSDELLTAKDAAPELIKQGVIKGVKPFTIKRWGRIGLIPVAKLGHRTIQGRSQARWVKCFASEMEKLSRPLLKQSGNGSACGKG